MVARQSKKVRFNETLSRRVVLAHFWPSRPAPNRGMDFGRQTRRPLPTPNAQVHLDADPAWCLTHATRAEALDRDFAAGPVAECAGGSGRVARSLPGRNLFAARGIEMVGKREVAGICRRFRGSARVSKSPD